MDILEKLNVDFSYGKLDFWLDFYVNSYVTRKKAFDETLSHLRQTHTVKSEAQDVARFEYPANSNWDTSAMVDFYSRIDSFVKKHQSESWEFSHLREEMEDFNLDPYEDYSDLRKVIYVVAYIKNDEQTTTLEQKQAMHMYQYAKLELDQAKESLEMYVKRIDNNV